LVAPKDLSNSSLWFILQKDKLLIKEDKTAKPVLPRLKDPKELEMKPDICHFMGLFEGVPCFAANAGPETDPPAGWVYKGLRGLTLKLGVEMTILAGTARQLLDWDLKNRFCGSCGAAMIAKTTERAKECPNCGLVRYPRISPAVIMAVTKGDKILLGRSPRFPKGMYSVLAGFVEIGETLEQTVAREIKEEVNLEVSNIRYFGSQPWPFPDSLMIGFTADYKNGELKPDPEEIADAGWYGVEDLPQIPTVETIARQLIDDFVARMNKSY
jgi:NAD+ diphosphatase